MCLHVSFSWMARNASKVLALCLVLCVSMVYAEGVVWSDDFLGTSLDTRIWYQDYTQTQPNHTKVLNGDLINTGLGGGQVALKTRDTFGRGTRFTWYGKIANTNQSYHYMGIGDGATYTYAFEHRWEQGSSTTLNVYRATESLVNLPSYYVDKYYTFSIDYGKDGIVRYAIDGVSVGSTTIPISLSLNFMMHGPHDAGLEQRVQWVRIVKY